MGPRGALYRNIWALRSSAVPRTTEKKGLQRPLNRRAGWSGADNVQKRKPVAPDWKITPEWYSPLSGHLTGLFCSVSRTVQPCVVGHPEVSLENLMNLD